MPRLVTLAAALLAAAPLFAEPRVVGFDQLPDPSALAFDDPFREMPLTDMEDLRSVVRLEARLATEEFDGDTRNRLSAKVTKARQSLTAKGYDIEALMASRWQVAVNRKRAQLATNPSYEGADVAFKGFLIPAEPDPDGVSVGYLVSEVGLCSHKPAPPPNQLVRVRYDGPFPSLNPYLPVSMSGTLTVAPKDQTIFLLDGTSRMVSMWELSAGQVIVNGPIGSSVNGQGKPGDLDPLAISNDTD